MDSNSYGIRVIDSLDEPGEYNGQVAYNRDSKNLVLYHDSGWVILDVGSGSSTSITDDSAIEIATSADTTTIDFATGTDDYLVLDVDGTITFSDGTDAPALDTIEAPEYISLEAPIVLLNGKELSKEYFESIEQKILNLEKKEDQPMFTVMNTLIIMLICVVTVKFVMPKLTIKYILRKFANLVYKPGKKKVEEIESEWEKAKAE